MGQAAASMAQVGDERKLKFKYGLKNQGLATLYYSPIT